MSMILMMVALFAIMYFFMIRPQNKKQKEIEKFRSALSVGQDVVTIGGIYGTVRSIDEAEDAVTDNQGLLFPNVGQAGFDFSVFSLSLHRLLVFPGPQ